MAPMLQVKPQIGLRVPKSDPVMVTALIYLRDALRAEKYEECAICVKIAQDFGASPADLRPILENPFRKGS